MKYNSVGMPCLALSAVSLVGCKVRDQAKELIFGGFLPRRVKGMATDSYIAMLLS